MNFWQILEWYHNNYSSTATITHMLLLLFGGMQIHVLILLIAPLVATGSVGGWRAHSGLAGTDVRVELRVKEAQTEQGKLSHNEVRV